MQNITVKQAKRGRINLDASHLSIAGNMRKIPSGYSGKEGCNFWIDPIRVKKVYIVRVDSCIQMHAM